MIFLNNIPVQDPNVYYDGKTLPKDSEPINNNVPVAPNVPYSGYNLPADRQQPQPIVIDPSNNPSSIVIGNVFLPSSTQIMLTGNKILAQSQIIDGVSVFEHIARHPYEIDFEVLIWSNKMNAPFPQETINNIWSGIWLPNTVQTLNNTYLNGLGIMQVIIRSVSPIPRLGSTNVVLKIKCWENQPGQTIIQ